MPRRLPFIISGKHFVTELLTDEQIKSIIEEYPFSINRELAEKYKVSKDLICSIASHYDIKKDKDVYKSIRGWKTNDEPVDLVMFDWFYPKTTNDQMMDIFGKSEHFIRNLGKDRGLEKYEDVLSARHSKSKPRVLYSVSNNHYESDEIDSESVKYIVENYATETNKYLSEKLLCKESIIVSVARYYELSKDQESVKNRRREILVHRNKNITGRDLNEDTLREIALQYHSKREFQYKDGSAYTSANRLGIMEDITKHMVNISFSIPQIITRQITEYLFKQKCEYNTRKIISPYELDVYFPNLKLAFEYDGKGWHINDEVDKNILCIELNLFLVTISERDRKYEEDIKTQLIENLNDINIWCNTKITKEDVLSFNEPIDFPKLFTEEELQICRQNTVSFLRENYNLLYERYRRYNPDNIDFQKSHNGKIVWDEEEVLKVLTCYSSKGELLKNNPACYQVIHKKFRHLLPLYGQPFRKKVLCLETNQEFESISEAGRVLGISVGLIDKVCRGKRSSTHGKTFKFI